MSVSGLVRKYCPDIKWLRDAMKWAKIRKIDKCALSESAVAAGEKGAAERDQCVAQCRKKWPEEYNQFVKAFEAIAGQNEPVIEQYGLENIKNDCLFCHFAYGFSEGEYFAFKLYEKSIQQRKSYVSDRYRQKMSYYMNDIIEMEVFFDKWKTSQKYAPFYKRDTMLAGSEKDFTAFEAFTQKHDTFVVKPYKLSRGRGVHLEKAPRDRAAKGNLFSDIIRDGKKILEEPIIQGDALGVFHPESVNTIRCVAIVKNNELHIPYCILRMGKGDSFVDNASAGGVFAIIDPETGEIVSDGIDENNNHYTEHPDTHIPFKGHRISQWDSLLEFVREIAFFDPKITYVGWDIAYCRDKGWMIVEGNCTCQLEARQVACGHGMKEEFDSIIGRKL